MHRTTRIKITELNPHLICVLCGGYYIDASTIIECLHSFCRTCIVRYLESSKYCPICDVMVHKTRPLQNVKSDKTLQDLVYKLVPGLYKNEMKRRRVLYGSHPEAPETKLPGPCEERGDEDRDRLIYTFDEKISLSLELYTEIVPEDVVDSDTGQDNPEKMKRHDVRYLQCPAAVTMGHLKKFIRMKFDLHPRYQIDIYHSDEPLDEVFTLMDVAYIYTWRRNSPLRLIYTVYDTNGIKRKSTEEAEGSSKEKQARMSSPESSQNGQKSDNPVVEQSCSNKSSSVPNGDKSSSNGLPNDTPTVNSTTVPMEEAKDLSMKSQKHNDITADSSSELSRTKSTNGEHHSSVDKSSANCVTSTSVDDKASNGQDNVNGVNCGQDTLNGLNSGEVDTTNGVGCVMGTTKDKTISAMVCKDKNNAMSLVKDKINSSVIAKEKTLLSNTSKEKQNGLSNGRESVYDFNDGRDSPSDKLTSSKGGLKDFIAPKKTYSKSPNGKVSLTAKDMFEKYVGGEVISHKLQKKLMKNKTGGGKDKSTFDCTGKVKSSKFNGIYTKHVFNGTVGN